MWVNLVDNEKMGEKKFGGSHAQGAGTNDEKGSLRSVCGYKKSSSGRLWTGTLYRYYSAMRGDEGTRRHFGDAKIIIYFSNCK